MAFTVTSQIVLDGARRATMHFTCLADGSGTQETLVKKVDATALQPPGSRSMKVRGINYDTFGPGLVILYWEAPVPKQFLTLSNTADHVDYSEFGGLWNNGVAGATGSILLSTQGFTAGSSYSITIDLTKGN